MHLPGPLPVLAHPLREVDVQTQPGITRREIGPDILFTLS